MSVFSLPAAKSVELNPSAEDLRKYAAEMPNARETEFGNLNVQTRVVARSKASTYIVSDDPSLCSDQTITREEYSKIASIQDEYISSQEMIELRGYIGNDPKFRVPARLYIERANANIAGMQNQLYYPAGDSPEKIEPRLTVIYTPNLAMPGYPNDRVIAVDLESGVTRVLNSDYFGESKKGGLRMWNSLVYQRGGLAMHAGCKVIPTSSGDKVMLIVGLSGTGKTTTTFTRQNNSKPCQDDFVALLPGGKVYATENGCFAKTFGLDPQHEPTIYGAVTKPHAYLENVSQDEMGRVDFHDESYTQNGRATFEFADIDAADARNLGSLDYLLILNRNENIIPGVARLNPDEAALYFMLGETQGTSAGGAEEAGKFLRVPGTNPFFPLRHALQGNRIHELLRESGVETFLLNTGRVGGPDSDDRSLKVQISHSSAIVKGIAEGAIQWEDDDDFGYEVATSVPGIDSSDSAILRPRLLYEQQGRSDEYATIVERLKDERRAYLRAFEGLDPEILEAVG